MIQFIKLIYSWRRISLLCLVLLPLLLLILILSTGDDFDQKYNINSDSVKAVLFMYFIPKLTLYAFVPPVRNLMLLIYWIQPSYITIGNKTEGGSMMKFSNYVSKYEKLYGRNGTSKDRISDIKAYVHTPIGTFSCW